MTISRRYPGQIEVPHRHLSSEALRGVAEEFVTREGTDYGDICLPLEEKVLQVLALLQRGEATLLFDPGTRRTHLVVASR